MSQKSKSIVVLTGAGISAESGIPTFRDADGIWQGHDPRQLATQAAFDHDPELVWRFYEWRRGLIDAGQPNRAHQLLVEMENSLDKFSVITQNVDGFHAQAGSRNVIRLHGSLWHLRCTHCLHRWEERRHPLPAIPPKCPRCDQIARPNVVWFGESLDPQLIRAAVAEAQLADIFLVIGTSGVVYPAAELPMIAKDHGAYLIEINPEVTPISSLMDEVRRGPASFELLNWWEQRSPALLNSD